jgi:hypothetical protein
LAHAGSNFYPFVWRAYRSHRATLFGLLDALPLRSTSQDTTVEQALRFTLRAHAVRTGEWLSTTRTERSGAGQTRQVPLLDFDWVPDPWWRLLTDESRRDQFPDRVHRRHFEACVFSQLMLELKAGDLCIVGSDAFADYREQLVSHTLDSTDNSSDTRSVSREDGPLALEMLEQRDCNVPGERTVRMEVPHARLPPAQVIWRGSDSRTRRRLVTQPPLLELRYAACEPDHERRSLIRPASSLAPRLTSPTTNLSLTSESPTSCSPHPALDEQCRSSFERAAYP